MTCLWGEIFQTGNPTPGSMKQHTGFYYQPESHLFDLVPELYCLDYVLGWMAETVMEKHLRERLGDRLDVRA